MSRPILAAAIGLAALGLAGAAEASIEQSPVLLPYGMDRASAAGPAIGQDLDGPAGKRQAYGNHGRTARSGRSGRTHTGHGGHGGGTSRSCLQASARALLDRIEAQFGPVQIVSTCRPGAVIATTGKPSKHRYGLAIDFRVPGRKAEVVRWLAANHHSGGTMTYRDMDHIHVDVGHHFVSLGASSGHGRRRARG